MKPWRLNKIYCASLTIVVSTSATVLIRLLQQESNSPDDATEDQNAVQSTPLQLRIKGPGGFSRRDWYSSRAFNRLPPGPVAPRQTPQDGKAAYYPGCCLLSHRANGEPDSSSEGVMHLWIMSLVPCTCSATLEASLARGGSIQWDGSSVSRVWGCACLAILTDTSLTTKKES
jgi:hypothetical protein